MQHISLGTHLQRWVELPISEQSSLGLCGLNNFFLQGSPTAHFELHQACWVSIIHPHSFPLLKSIDLIAVASSLILISWTSLFPLPIHIFVPLLLFYWHLRGSEVNPFVYKFKNFSISSTDTLKHSPGWESEAKREPKRSWILGKMVPFALDPGTGLFEGMF